MSTHDTTRVRRPRTAVLAAVVAGLALLGAALDAAPTAAQSGGETQVTVVHGLRGELVDVYLDGTLLLEGFQPDRLTDPMTVPAGVHTVDLRPAGSPASDPPKATASPDLPAGPVAVVAHFAPDGSWTMSVFTEATAQVPAGTGRVVFRNTAGVTPIDVAIDSVEGTQGIDIGAEAGRDLPEGTYAVAVTDRAGTAIIPDSDVDVTSGSAVALYLVGTGQNATWLVQELGATAAGPQQIAAGNSGLLGGDGRSAPPVVLALIVAGLALIGGSSVALRRRHPPVTSAA